MPVSLQILSQGNEHPKPSLGLHGDQESPVESARWGPHNIHDRRRVRCVESVPWGSVRRGSQATEAAFYAINDFSFLPTFLPVRQSRVQKTATEN